MLTIEEIRNGEITPDQQNELDELVHDVIGNLRSDINNGDPAAFLAKEGVVVDTEDDWYDLVDKVDDVMGAKASGINNSGTDSQVTFLLKHLSADLILAQLEEA